MSVSLLSPETLILREKNAIGSNVDGGNDAEEHVQKHRIELRAGAGFHDGECFPHRQSGTIRSRAG
jgi:hypothetical protein